MLIDGFIQDREDLTKSIKFLYFQEITNNVNANYEETDIRGRSESHPFYLSTSADTYNLDIKLVASVDENDAGTTKKIHNDYLFLKSFQYPDYLTGDGGVFKPPRQVIIVIGSFFRKRGIIKEPSFVFRSPYDEKGFPHAIDCAFTFRAVHYPALGLEDIRRGAGTFYDR